MVIPSLHFHLLIFYFFIVCSEVVVACPEEKMEEEKFSSMSCMRWDNEEKKLISLPIEELNFPWDRSYYLEKFKDVDLSNLSSLIIPNFLGNIEELKRKEYPKLKKIFFSGYLDPMLQVFENAEYPSLKECSFISRFSASLFSESLFSASLFSESLFSASFFSAWSFNYKPHLSDIKKYVKIFPQLEILTLSNVYISNLDELKEEEYPNLTTLDINSCPVELLKAFEKAKFHKLLILAITSTEIDSLKVLGKMLFPFDKLKTLNLSSNQINSIEILQEMNLECLETLCLGDNKIVLFSIKKCYIPKIKFLDFAGKYILNLEEIVELDAPFMDHIKFNDWMRSSINDCSSLYKVKIDIKEVCDLGKTVGVNGESKYFGKMYNKKDNKKVPDVTYYPYLHLIH